MRNSFVFYGSWWEAIKNLPRDVQGDVLTAIIEYGLSGETTEQLKPIAKAMLAMVKPQIDANNQRFENGKKGGRKKPETNQTGTGQEPNKNQNETKTEPKPNQTETYNENVYENVNDIIPPNPPKGRGKKKTEPKTPDFVSPEYVQAFTTWMEYKHERRESYKSDKSLRAAYSKLLQLSGNDPQKAASIVEQSMANNWAGLFELKEPKHGANTGVILTDNSPEKYRKEDAW